MSGEGQVLHACIQWLCLHGCDIIRNNTGAFRKSYTRKDGTQADYHIRVGKKGSGDILACSPYGRWVEVETKFDKGKQRPEQQQRQADIERRNGVYVLAYGVDDLEARKDEILSEQW